MLVLAIGSAVAIGAKRVGDPLQRRAGRRRPAPRGRDRAAAHADGSRGRPRRLPAGPGLRGGALRRRRQAMNARRPPDPRRSPCRASPSRSSATAAVATFALGLPFARALLLGALLAITDTVSVLLAFRSVRVPHRLAGDHGGREPLQRRHRARARERRRQIVMSGRVSLGP